VQNPSPAATEQRMAPREPFIHQPHAPRVPAEAEYCQQRNFSRDTGELHLAIADSHSHVRVFRWGHADHVELTIRTSTKHTHTDTTTDCTAAELREIASRLLDAAHDLDHFPARVLEGCAA
jgi:hypothetical protein